MDINDLKENDRIRTTFEYYLACKTRIFLKSKETELFSVVLYISNDYIISKDNYYSERVYIFLNAEKLNLQEYE
jgi:hypothetical protein